MKAIDEFRALLNARKLSPLTVRGYLCDVHQFLTWLNCLGLPLDAVTPVEAREYLKFLSGRQHELRPGVWGNYSITTVKRKILSVRIFFDSLEMVNG